MEEKKRMSYPLGMFDLIKGLGLIGVVFFHSMITVNVSSWICYVLMSVAGLMGIFYAICGFQFHPLPASAAVKRYAKTYLPPYFRLALYVLLGLAILDLFVAWHSYIPVMIGYMLAFLLGTVEPVMLGPVAVEDVVFGWFFLALLWGSILLNLILKINSARIRIFCVIILGILAVYLEFQSFEYYCLYRGFQAVPTMYLGYYLQLKFSEDKGHMRKKSVLYVFYVVVMLLAAYIAQPQIPVWVNQLTRPLFELAWGYAGILFSRHTVALSNCVFEFIRKIGRYSSWVLILHSVENVCFPWYLLLERLPADSDFTYLVFVLCRCVIIFLGCVLMDKITRFERQLKRKYRRKTRRKNVRT